MFLFQSSSYFYASFAFSVNLSKSVSTAPIAAPIAVPQGPATEPIIAYPPILPKAEAANAVVLSPFYLAKLPIILAPWWIASPAMGFNASFLFSFSTLFTPEMKSCPAGVLLKMAASAAA